MRKIYNYVFKGGRYLGICAGGYFAAAYSHFVLPGEAPLIKTRPLRFYIGSAIGPINPNPLAVKVELLAQNRLKEGLSYYLGGPSFDILESSYLTRVLLRYSAPFRGAAAISNIVGDGRAVMCGLHPEFSFDPTMQNVTSLALPLSENEAFREEIWKILLEELLI
jgi:biotin---protein ligase